MADLNLAQGGPAPNSVRVCLLAESNPNACWVPYYVEAFKEHCDAVTVGTARDFGSPRNDAERFLFDTARPCDLELEEPSADCLLDSLPTGWHPHLTVAIQSGGTVLRDIHQLDCVTAYVTIDTWHDPNEYTVARHYDFVFAAQRSFIPHLRATGSARVSWLPLACSPKWHHPAHAAKDFDVVFVGSTDQRIYDERVHRLRLLGEQFAVATLKTYLPEEVCATNCRGKLAFNSSASHDVNMRVFEAMAMGCPLLTDANARDNGLFDLFEDGTHLVAYTDGDLVEKARRYLEDEEARKKVARAGRTEVLARHTYAHRVATIVDTVRESFPGPDSLGIASYSGSVRGRPDLPAVPGTVATPDPAMVTPADTRAGRWIRVALEGEPRNSEDPDSVSWSEMDGLAGGIDTVVAMDPKGCGLDLENFMAAAHEWLVDGGQLVLRVPVEFLPGLALEAARDSLALWLQRQRFHLIGLTPPGTIPAVTPASTYLIAARKRTRTLRDICREVYARHPMTGLSLDELLAAIPEGF